MPAERAFDVVLFGATGFTGALTAEYLAANAPAQTRWALAGRNRSKLEALRATLAEANPACAELELLHADVEDADSLRAVAAATSTVITTVGPYINYGPPLVEACAEAGTDYVDLTGEPEFVDLMYVRHHAKAVDSGARIVHCCGFDSIPHDLGAYYTVKQLPEGVPLTVSGYVRAGGTFSGGTAHSAITAFSRMGEWRKVSAERAKVEPRPEGRSVKGIKGRPHRVGEIGAWALPMPTIDPQIVLRSARALDRYGPDFRYGHYVALKHLPQAVGLPIGVAGLFTMAQIPPARKWLLNRRQPGDGPTPEQRAKGWFNVHFHGEGGGATVATEVSGGDPGYGETAKMLAESALCLAHDDLPQSAGQVTTVEAMGDALIERLVRADIGFNTVSNSG
jgi:short subunit dehydrogenase-like uncharacterized protein